MRSITVSLPSLRPSYRPGARATGRLSLLPAPAGEHLRLERVGVLAAAGLRLLDADDDALLRLEVLADDLGHLAVAEPGLDLDRPDQVVLGLDPEHALLEVLLGAAGPLGDALPQQAVQVVLV